MCPFLLILRCIFPDLFQFSGINEKMRQNLTYFIAYNSKVSQISTAPVGAAIGRPPVPGRFAARVDRRSTPTDFLRTCRGGLYIRPRQLRFRRCRPGAYQMRPYTRVEIAPHRRGGHWPSACTRPLRGRVDRRSTPTDFLRTRRRQNGRTACAARPLGD